MNATGSRINGVSSAWNERMRMIRLRRQRERTTFRDEFKLVPLWLRVACLVVLIIAEIVAAAINISGVANNGQIWPPGTDPVVGTVALASLVLAMWLISAFWILLAGYVYRDAKRRGMNATLWTILCLLLVPAYFVVGFIIYFLVREPLPYPCPKCGATVGPRFNFCANCQYDLHPSCPNCKREVVETDRFCPHCGCELKPTTVAAAPQPQASS
jgi:hypothetical protein